MAAIPPPEIFRTRTARVACDGTGGIANIPPALGHPRVYLQVDDATGFVDCGYCDRRFILEGGSGDRTSDGA